MKVFIATILLLSLLSPCVYAFPKPAPVNEYAIHEDGGLVYDPLRREAEKVGQLARYKNAKMGQGKIQLGQYTLRYSVPKKATAYDVIPIDYELSWKGKSPQFPLAVEATAFEEEPRRKGRDLYDLALPGKIDLKVEFLGSITANMNGKRHNLTSDMSDTPGHYPGYDRHPLARSGVVEAGDLVWFKFRIKNTGDTILDPEGIGGFQFYPEIHKKNDKGNYENWGQQYNLYIRDLEYLYPGEAHDIWFHLCKAPYGLSTEPGLKPGEYLVKVKAVYRAYKEFNTWLNMWDGPPMYIYEIPFTVEPKPRQVPVSEGKITLTDGGDPDKITRWLHTHEEFMTAFDCHIKEPKTTVKSRRIKGTLHLQVAPWTKHIMLKVIGVNPMSIKSIAVPINVESDSLKVKFNPNTQMTIVKDGLREPCIWSQCMADMRTNIQLSPYPEFHIPERMKEMMDCGINVTAFTSMPWLYDDMHKPKMNFQGDAWKYYLDCARREGMLAEGWGAYPYDRSSIQDIHNWITGEKLKMDVVMNSQYPAISHTEPSLPGANASAWLFQFHRWGDLYYQMQSGEVPIGIEDTRGWMRQDVNVRYEQGARTLEAFREWSRSKYGSIEAANKAWGSNYKSFDEVNPEANQVKNVFGWKWEYTDRKQVFHDWSPAIEDFDRFRTELRAKNYKDTLEIVGREIPDVKFLLRTEGANVVVDGIDPESPNAHLRHIYYSQRRCGIIADILQKSGAVRWHSDYTTIPYTPSELKHLTRKAVEQGIIPIYLAQFDNMRDIAVNAKYGTPYETHYNLPEPRSGQMMHVLTALYPWFKAVYEAGGVPGILWEDYQCDGFATATQKREMRFFKQKLQEALNAPAAKKARAADIKKPSQDWRKNCSPKECYVLPKEK